MGPVVTLLRNERRARIFFAAVAQSSIGSGAAYVGLLLLAYERLHSPWAVSLILLADFLPSILFGALLGAVADRWSRRWCAVMADVVRAVAFGGLALVGGFEATLAFALLAGLGTALFRPAALAGLPGLVSRTNVPAAVSLYGVLTDFGYVLGPATAAGALLFLGPADLMALNGVSFAVSALLLVWVPLGQPERLPSTAQGNAAPSLLRETREGLRATAGMPAIRVVLVASAGAMFFGGVFNVVELPFATSDLGAANSTFAALIAIFGLGFIAGSLRGSKGGDAPDLKRRYLVGVALMGAGALAAGFAPSVGLAFFGFAIGGLGNGLFVVHERLLLQSQVAGRLQGRVFGINDALSSVGLAMAFGVAGGLVGLLGARSVVIFAGAGGLLLALAAGIALQSHWKTRAPAAPAVPSAGHSTAG
jgi:MFS family permease